MILDNSRWILYFYLENLLLCSVASVGDQQDSIEMHYEDENIWLTQKMMATLYDVSLPTSNAHIKKIYADSELEKFATIRNFPLSL